MLGILARSRRCRTGLRTYSLQMSAAIIKTTLVFGIATSSIGFANAPVPRGSEIKVSLAIPQICDYRGQPRPRSLAVQGPTDRFEVVIENVSSRPLQVWAEGNSAGDETLSFQVSDASGHVTVVQPVSREYTKNLMQTVRLMPGETCIRSVYYNTNPPSWIDFPRPATGQPIKTTMRAILNQPGPPSKQNPELWNGRTTSAPLEVSWWAR